MIWRSGKTGAVDLRMSQFILLMDISTLAFSLSMGLSTAWPLFLLAATSAMIKLIIMYLFRWVRLSELASQRRSNTLVYLGNTFKHFLPYMWLYRLFAFIMMPKKRHKESRLLFVREAKRLCQKEFIKWFKLAMDVNPLMQYFKEKDIDIPILYIMGKEDHMFLGPVKEMVKRHKNSVLQTIHHCGHVCNVERPDLFNQHSLAFIAQQNR